MRREEREAVSGPAGWRQVPSCGTCALAEKSRSSLSNEKAPVSTTRAFGIWCAFSLGATPHFISCECRPCFNALIGGIGIVAPTAFSE
jgi:hypothetical protein